MKKSPEEQLDKKWEIHKVVQEAVTTAHYQPSPETKAELNNIKKEIASDKEAHKLIMDKLDKFGEKLEEVSITIAKLPEKILEKTDSKYASKNLEEEVRTLRDKTEQRNYDWLKYAIVTSVAALLTYLGLK